MTLSFARFLEVSGGRFLADAAIVPQWFVPSSDSRTISHGEAFVCLHGPTFDGHDFIAQALEQGASAVVVDDDAKAPRQSSVPVIRVADTKRAYLAGAAAARRSFSGRVIAVTGSNGKTTTKEFAAQILRTRRRVLATPQNENNELGVAKLCYRLSEDSDVAVIEFGARHPGEIGELVELAAPDIGILTNIAEAHREFFADQTELARTKFAIFGQGAQAVCSAADDWTRMLAAEAKMDAAALWVRMVGDPMMAGIMLEAGNVSEGKVPVTFGASHAFAAWNIPGEHNLRDALLACGAAVLAGLTLEESLAAFGQLRLPPGRFETHQTPSGATVIYDAYNASPTSMLSALRTFAQVPAARHIAVLGSMAELGPEAAVHHERVGAEVARLKLDGLHCGGLFAAALADGAERAGLPRSSISIFDNNAEITSRLIRELGPGDCVLLKGSRVQKMEEILDGLLTAGMLAS